MDPEDYQGQRKPDEKDSSLRGFSPSLDPQDQLAVEDMCSTLGVDALGFLIQNAWWKRC